MTSVGRMGYRTQGVTFTARALESAGMGWRHFCLGVRPRLRVISAYIGVRGWAGGLVWRTHVVTYWDGSFMSCIRGTCIVIFGGT